MSGLLSGEGARLENRVLWQGFHRKFVAHCFLLAIALLWQEPAKAQVKAFSPFLIARETAFVKMPDISIASIGVAPKWSEDSGALLVETLSGSERTLRARRRSLQQGGKTPLYEHSLLRYTVETGEREILYRVAEGEVLGERIFVGPGADVLFSVMRVASSGALTYQLYFAPAGSAARPVGATLSSRVSPKFIASSRSARALVAVTTPDNQLQMFLITPEETRPVAVPGKWQFAQFTGNTRSGTARIAVGQVDENQNSSGMLLDADYQTGKVSEVTRDNARFELPERTPPLFREEVYRTARTARLLTTASRLPLALTDDSLPALTDLDLLEEGPTPRRLAIARGVDVTAERSPDGLKLAYQTPHGFFLVELVPLSPEQSRKKRESKSP